MFLPKNVLKINKTIKNRTIYTKNKLYCIVSFNVTVTNRYPEVTKFFPIIIFQIIIYICETTIVKLNISNQGNQCLCSVYV